MARKKLNVALSNRPWTDADATIVAPGGKEAGIGKRSLLKRFSLLVLNKGIVDDHETEWTERDIVSRSEHLAEAVTKVWARNLT